MAFENVPVTTREAFLKLRDEDDALPFGQLPLLQHEGVSLSQCLAVGRYVARRTGLWPQDDPQAATVDMFVEASKDLVSPPVRLPFQVHRGGEDEAEVKAGIIPAITRTLNWVEKRAGENGQAGVLVGDAVTAADVYIAYALFQVCKAVTGDGWDTSPIQETWPAATAVLKTVTALPGVAQYLKGPQRYPAPGAAYVKQVDTVLGRA